MMNRSKNSAAQTPEARARDNQTKFIREAVTKVEKNFGTICGQMGAVNRRSSRLRDKFDEMAKFMLNYANTEPGPLKVTLTQFAEHISAVQDYRQALIDRMDGKVIQPLSQYKSSCKHTQTDLNNTMKSRGRVVQKHKQLDSYRNKAPSDRQQITRAETELQRATIDVERSTKNLEETIDTFESKRVTDIKKILLDFVQIEMLFHAKALERFTMCYNDLEKMSLDDHLVLFRNSLRPTQAQVRLDLVRQTAGMDLNAQQQQQPQQYQQGPLGDLYTTPQRQDTTPMSHDPTRPRGQHQEYEDQEEYDDEDEEYTEDEYGSEEEDEEDEEGDSPPPQHQQRLKPW
ncbi:CBY1-interacting BAR domain-containing protein 1-A-like [Styela clava]